MRPERKLRTAGQLSAEVNADVSNNFQEEGIRFLQKGAIHSGWDLRIMLFPPAMFDEDVAESGRLGRAELLAKKGASGRMQRPAELVPIPSDP